MQPNPIPGEADDGRDRRHEAAVLSQVVWLHPTHLTEGELLRSLFAGDTDTDAWERAVRDLVSYGLLRREGDSILPTLAALEAGKVSR